MRARQPWLGLWLALVICLTAHFGAQAQPSAFKPDPLNMTAQVIGLNPQVPSQNKIGAFRFAGGLVLTSPANARFGGLSDLVVNESGGLTAVGDEGSLVLAKINIGADGQLAGLGTGQITAITGQDGKPLTKKTQADAEGLAVWPNGDLMISFEHEHRIWLYPSSGERPRAVPRPKVAMPPNDGMEGLSLAPSQGVDAYWVGVEAGGIWLCHLHRTCKPYPSLPKPPAGFRLSALREGPGGVLYILHHRWAKAEGSRIVLSLVANPTGRTPKVVQTLSLAPPLNTDNFEGLAVTRSPSGAQRVYLLSDDNFSQTQKTLLMALDLMPSTGP